MENYVGNIYQFKPKDNYYFYNHQVHVVYFTLRHFLLPFLLENKKKKKFNIIVRNINDIPILQLKCPILFKLKIV